MMIPESVPNSPQVDQRKQENQLQNQSFRTRAGWRWRYSKHLPFKNTDVDDITKWVSRVRLSPVCDRYVFFYRWANSLNVAKTLC